MAATRAKHTSDPYKQKRTGFILCCLLVWLAVVVIARTHLGRDQKLIVALRNQEYAHARTLLSTGINPNVRETPSESLLEHITVNLQNGTPALLIALGEGQPGSVHADPATIRMMLDHGADPNVRDSSGDSPLQLAALLESSLGNPQELTDIGILLLQHGADANSNPYLVANLLDHAVTEQSASRVQVLLAYCPKLFLTQGGNVLFDAVCMTGKPDLQIVKMLLDAGASINDYPIFHEAVFQKNAALMQLLLNYGAKPQPDDLIQAAYDGRKDLMQLLLARGANPNSPGYKNRTAVHAGIESGFSDAQKAKIIDILLRAGANPNTPSDGSTPLKYAADRRLIQSVAVLEQYGATSSGR